MDAGYELYNVLEFRTGDGVQEQQDPHEVLAHPPAAVAPPSPGLQDRLSSWQQSVEKALHLRTVVRVHTEPVPPPPYF